MNGQTLTPRAKRKEPPHPLGGRHAKHHRLNGGGELSAGDNTPDIDDGVDAQEDYFEDPRQVLPLVGPDTAEWQATIESVVQNVVSIRFCQTCSFDTDPALTSEATGFVVDAERGYVPVIRHVHTVSRVEIASLTMCHYYPDTSSPTVT